MLTNEELVSVLRSNGCKVTPQRIAVYEALANTKEHPTAEMIYRVVHPSYPTMSFATVYKSVEILEKLHIIQKLNTGEDMFRYDADVAPHSHIQCTACGRVDDVTDFHSDLTEQVATATGYDVTDQQMYFYGVCPACKAHTHQ